MSIEAMKQALEALRFGLHVGFDESSESQIKKGSKAFDQHNKAITALRQALEQQPADEPVAVKHMMQWVESLKRLSDNGQHMKIPSELSAGTCWELAIELEQFINTRPQPAAWVNATTWRGLTDEEIDQGLLRSDYALQTAHAWRAGVVFAMTKLKEKNYDL